MAEILVPALSPKPGHGHREPWPVRDAWPLRDRLVEHDLANDGAELVQDVGGAVDDIMPHTEMPSTQRKCGIGSSV